MIYEREICPLLRPPAHTWAAQAVAAVGPILERTLHSNYDIDSLLFAIRSVRDDLDGRCRNALRQFDDDEIETYYAPLCDVLGMLNSALDHRAGSRRRMFVKLALDRLIELRAHLSSTKK